MKYEIKKFKNGLRALVAPMKNTEAVTTLVLVGTGSVYENKKTSGVSHFLEHLFFKGSKRRPSPGEVNRALDGMGAEHNAFTSKEVTGFWVKSATKHFDRALDIVSDILINPLFRPDDVERERGVILQELSMYEDMPQRDVMSVLDSTIYGDQPAGWDIGGTKDTVKGITHDNIVSYKENQYVTSNTLVVVAGNVSPSAVFAKIENAFSLMPKGKAKEKPTVKYKQSSLRVKFKHKKSDQTHIAFGIQTFGMFDDRKYALNLLGGILGGNMSSRLFMEIREKLGLAYYIGARPSLSTYGGSLIINAGIPHNSLKKVTSKIMDIIMNIRKNGVSEREVKFAKDYIRGTMALSFESSDEVAMFFGEQALFFKDILTPQEIWGKIEQVSKDDILKISKEMFSPKRINLAVIGPHKDTGSIKAILSKK